ncbi:hypothetical protein HDV05_004927 [Chytridiales sp. JEL 0842]|nr:hypothetical protein HDV05_004927 [Chytridiales sp. JEL 0842]
MAMADAIVDAHCHIAESPETLHLVPALKVKQVWIMSAKTEEWSETIRCHNQWPERVVGALGIHPWYAHNYKTVPASGKTEPEWLIQQRTLLKQNPTMLLGEIGLDGIATHPGTKEKYDLGHQLEIFKMELKLAAELRRPTSIHLVQCHGKMLDIFDQMAIGVPKPLSKKKLNKLKNDGEEPEDPEKTPEALAALSRWPPAIMLHSYSGSPDQVKKLLRLPAAVASRFYFSFSHVVNGRSQNIAKTFEKIRVVPDSRILIESDLHDSKDVDDACLAAAKLVAEAKGWSLEDTIKTTSQNAASFLSSAAQCT